ncbi:MAG: HNH endonuclease, partial [Asticcacaulis sp.]
VESWAAEFVADKTNVTKKYRYRHKDIKSSLVAETSNKCVYCESKIGHNTPGDVEHKIPSSIDADKHFEWDNLTVACTECNRRKNAYFSVEAPFLDPYVDDVESRLVHVGPVVCWAPGDATAEISVRTLEMHDSTRHQLIMRKIEAIDRLNNIVARIESEAKPLKELLLLSLERMKSRNAEFSAMICAVCKQYGF